MKHQKIYLGSINVLPTCRNIRILFKCECMRVTAPLRQNITGSSTKVTYQAPDVLYSYRYDLWRSDVDFFSALSLWSRFGKGSWRLPGWWSSCWLVTAVARRAASLVFSLCKGFSDRRDFGYCVIILHMLKHICCVFLLLTQSLATPEPLKNK